MQTIPVAWSEWYHPCSVWDHISHVVGAKGQSQDHTCCPKFIVIAHLCEILARLRLGAKNRDLLGLRTGVVRAMDNA